MNADRRRWWFDSSRIGVDPRSSATKHTARRWSFDPRRRHCRAGCLFGIAIAIAFPAAAQQPLESQPLRRAAEFLWSQQADDGGWHSEQYAVLRSGQALTPFVLHTLLHVPQSVYPRPEDKVDRGLHFIRDHADRYGHLGHADPELVEYPVYSTAYAIRCLLEAQDPFAWDAVVDRHGAPARTRTWEQKAGILVSQMMNFLIAAQFTEDNGFTSDSPAYGGWGFDAPQKPGAPGHMDLAHTRRALQSLDSIYIRWLSDPRRQPGRQRMLDRATQFLKVVQRHPDARDLKPRIDAANKDGPAPPFDGGFYFSPVVLAANKGREEQAGDSAHFRSYATATCDGILALLAAGVRRDDARVQQAAEWLRQHDDLTYPQGVPTTHPEPWGDAIRFYHYAVRAEAYAALDWPGDWRQQLAAEILRHQAPDGSFRNAASPLMKEDDPLLCTALAAVALTHCARGTSE